MSFYGDPPDPIEDPRDDSERWEEAFKAVEDERAEFEATFEALGYDLTRWERHATDDNPLCDYASPSTGHAWRGWLCAADVQWCMES